MACRLAMLILGTVLGCSKDRAASSNGAPAVVADASQASDGVPAAGEGGGSPGTGGPGGASGAPTFTAIYDEILVNYCSGPICHSGSAGGNLVMTSREGAYAALVSIPAEGVTLPGICEGMPPNCADLGILRVAPHDPEGSLLLDKITHAQPRCGCPMPTSPPPLEQGAVDQIRTWIMLGAQDN